MNMELYQGVIAEESLEDNRTLNKLPVISVRITDEDDPAKRWHLYTVALPRENIPLLKDKIKEGWYMHFWRENDVVVVFKDNLFILDYKNKSTWRDAIRYGINKGIPVEQLDFLIEE